MKRMILVLVVVFLSSQCFGQATLAKFNRIKNGMTFSEVKAIMGTPDKELIKIEYGNYEESSYQWDGPNERGMAAVGFQNGKVTMKSQVFLE